jgi:cytochrome b
MSEELRPVRVWDLPTRVFHWVLVLTIVASVVSAKIGGNAMVWHMRLGYLVFTLLAFRLVWGFVGGHWSRFAAFVYSPAALVQYLRRASPPHAFHDVGHSPLGALSVFALLAILAVQVATGLFADDEIATTGPLVRFVSGATSSLLTSWHKAWGQWLVIALAVLHILAVMAYRFAHGRDLVGPMIRGDKLLTAGVPAARDGARERIVALVIVAVCAVAVAALVSLGG